MVAISKLFLLKALGGAALAAGDRIIEFGEASFTTTGTTKEVSTQLSRCDFAVAFPKTVTYNVNDQLSSDGAITSDAITVARNSSGTNGLTFYYLFIGIIED